MKRQEKKLKKVLVIDDDEVTCFLHSAVLESMEVSEEIHCIHDIEEALEYVQACIKSKLYPDLILLDVKMPGLDGFELLNILKTLSVDEKNKLNVVILSTFINETGIEIAASFGDLLKGYFLKPLDEALMEKILLLIPYNDESPKGKEKLSPSDN